MNYFIKEKLFNIFFILKIKIIIKEIFNIKRYYLLIVNNLQNKFEF